MIIEGEIKGAEVCGGVVGALNVRRARKRCRTEVEDAGRKSVQPHSAPSVVDINRLMAFQWLNR